MSAETPRIWWDSSADAVYVQQRGNARRVQLETWDYEPTSPRHPGEGELVELVPLAQRPMALIRAIYYALESGQGHTGLRQAKHVADAVIRDLTATEPARAES